MRGWLRSSAGALRRRPALAAALIYAVLALVFVGPALLPGKTLSNSDTLWFEPPWVGVKPPELKMPSNTELGDAPGQLQSFVQYTEARLPDIPLWNPHIAGGRPFLANGQSGIFSIYNAPAYVLPYWTALPWTSVLKLWVAAFGMFLLGRALGMRFGGALTAGLIYAFSLWMVTWLSYPHMSVWTLIPWMLLLTDRLVRRPDLFSISSLAAVMAAQILCGHPESSVHALLAAIAFLALRLVQAHRAAAPQQRQALRTVLAFGGAVAGGAAVAALVILPFLELVLNSADLADRSGDSIDHAPLLKEFALGLFLPDYWGRATATPLRLFVLDRAIYVGALPLMLAAAALIIRPTMERVAVALFGLLWMLVLFGIPPFLQIVTRLPVFSSGHNSRLIVFWVLTVALLAGWGLDELSGERRRERRRLVLGVGAILLVIPAIVIVAGRRTSFSALGQAIEVAWGFATPPGAIINFTGGRACAAPCVEAGDVIRLASLIGWLTLAAAAILLLALRFRNRLGPAPFVALAALLICVDLFYAGMGYNPAIDRKYASQPATGAVRFLQRQPHARFVGQFEIPPNVIPMKFGLYEARGYDLPIMRRYDRLWRREVTPEFASLTGGLLDVPLTIREITSRSLHTLRLLGVSHIMQPAGDRPLTLDGVKVVYDGPDARVYSVAGALPRAFVVGAQQVVPDDDAALDAIARRDFDGRTVAVTERRLAGLTDAEAGASATAPGSARILSYQPERVVVRAHSDGRGLLVLSDNHYPGWKAKVDGRPVPIERVDYVLRGVPIGAGEHEVEFRYEPLTWRIGWLISLAALVALAFALAIGWRRRRQVAAPS